MDAGVTRRDVAAILERAARATPATVEDSTGGWWLRHTDTAAWWSGAVLAHGPADALDRRVDAAERFAAAHGGVPRFQVCPGCPPGLDALLAGRGYRRECPVDLLTADARAAPPWPPGDLPEGLDVRVAPSPGPGWLAVTGATAPAALDVARETSALARVGPPQAFVTVLDLTLPDATAPDGAVPVGAGRAVADTGWTGVFGMATVPVARRRGVARAVLAEVARWALAQGAPRLYLQVERANAAARGLYAVGGFTPLAAYHYRVGPGRP